MNRIQYFLIHRKNRYYKSSLARTLNLLKLVCTHVSDYSRTTHPICTKFTQLYFAKRIIFTIRLLRTQYYACLKLVVVVVSGNALKATRLVAVFRLARKMWTYPLASFLIFLELFFRSVYISQPI